MYSHGSRRWISFKLQTRATCGCAAVWQHRSKSVCTGLACCRVGWTPAFYVTTAPLKAGCANASLYKRIFPSFFTLWWARTPLWFYGVWHLYLYWCTKTAVHYVLVSGIAHQKQQKLVLYFTYLPRRSLATDWHKFLSFDLAFVSWTKSITQSFIVIG